VELNDVGSTATYAARFHGEVADMKRVVDLLAGKKAKVWTATPELTVLDAIALMEMHDIGALPVLDRTGWMEGLFTERDYARKVILCGRRSLNTRVSDVMETRPPVAWESDSISRCMKRMKRRRFRYLPVKRDDRVVGIVSIGDIMNAVMQEKDTEIRHLERYILGPNSNGAMSA
jgi:CBS domain-containing protein